MDSFGNRKATEWKIIDMMGREVKRMVISNEKTQEVDVAGLEAGTNIVALSGADGSHFKEFVKR